MIHHGFGIGSLVAPLFIGEIAPETLRGRLIVINSFWLTGGQSGSNLDHSIRRQKFFNIPNIGNQILLRISTLGVGVIIIEIFSTN